MMRKAFRLLLGALAIGFAVSARAGDAPRHVDLARWYFATPAAELAYRSALAALYRQLQAMHGRLLAAPANLFQALSLNDRILRSYGRHDAYLLLRCRMDKTDGTACADDNALASDLTGKTAFLATEAAALTPAKLAQFLKREPALARYRFWIERAMQNRKHLLAGSQEALLGDFAPDISGWQHDLYDAAISSADFGTVTTRQGALDVRRQRNLIAVDGDPSVRRQGFEKRFAAVASVRDRIAFALEHTVQAGNRTARAHGFANAPDRKYVELGLDPSAVRATIERVSAQGELHKRFERIRIADVRHGLGLTEAGPWDMDVPLVATANRPLPDAIALFHAAFAPLGAWYQDAFTALLDPANGRFDIVPGGAAHRSGGGFAVGFAGAQSALFVGNYDGTFRDLCDRP